MSKNIQKTSIQRLESQNQSSFSAISLFTNDVHMTSLQGAKLKFLQVCVECLVLYGVGCCSNVWWTKS